MIVMWRSQLLIAHYLLYTVLLRHCCSSSSLVLIKNSKYQLQRELLSEATLRLGYYYAPPLFYPDTESSSRGHNNVTYKGMIVEVIDWMIRNFKFKVQYVTVSFLPSDAHATLTDRVIRHLLGNETDMATVPLPMQWEFLTLLDYTIVMQVEDFNLMQKWPEQTSHLDAFRKPFSPTVWCYFVSTVFVVIAFMAVVTFIGQRWKRGLRTTRAISGLYDHISHHMQYVFTTITNQGNYISYSSVSSLFVIAGSWCLMMTVMINAYQGNLMSSIVTPTFAPIANSLDELVRMNGKVAVYKGTPLAESFLTAVSGPNKVLGDWLRKNPKLLISNLTDATLHVLREDRCAYVSNYAYLRVIIAKAREMHGKCRLTISKPLTYTESYAFALRKGSPYMDAINQDLQYLWERGLFQYWINLYFPPIGECAAPRNEPKRQLRPFTLIDLSSVFLLLIAGIVLASIVLCCEWIAFFVRSIRTHSIAHIAGPISN